MGDQRQTTACPEVNPADELGDHDARGRCGVPLPCSSYVVVDFELLDHDPGLLLKSHGADRVS
jgi:hypothetical protein